ncbi:MAG: cytochrome o ubiquinol oxidase subunit IV [Rhizobiaceae bacterium]
MNGKAQSSVADNAHFIGFGLAVVLSAIPFAAVGFNWFSPAATISVIALAAIVQIAVHLRFFLDISFKSHRPRAKVSLLFAIVLMVIMIGGTLWIMTDLAYRMGH